MCRSKHKCNKMYHYPCASGGGCFQVCEHQLLPQQRVAPIFRSRDWQQKVYRSSPSCFRTSRRCRCCVRNISIRPRKSVSTCCTPTTFGTTTDQLFWKVLFVYCRFGGTVVCGTNQTLVLPVLQEPGKLVDLKEYRAHRVRRKTVHEVGARKTTHVVLGGCLLLNVSNAPATLQTNDWCVDLVSRRVCCGGTGWTCANVVF